MPGGQAPTFEPWAGTTMQHTQHTDGPHDDTPLAAALGYAARGWRVIPIPPGRKHPAIPAWQTAGTTDHDRIRHWWTAAPDHGVGIVTGAASRLWVLDVDVAGDKAGDDTLAELEAAYGALPGTYEVITGSGGRHLYFTWPDDGTEVRNSASSRLGPGLDVRGEGGQVLAPPTIHPNGQPYALEASATLQVAAAPGWLLAMLHDHEQPATAAAPATIGDRPGDAWAEATTWNELLTADGWTHHHDTPDGEQHWTRPGKDRREGTSATVGYRGSDVLKVFTTSHPQLKPDATYTKLGYLAATRHDGDHRAAARTLAADGWGPRRSDDHSPRDLVTPTTPAAAPDAPWPAPQPLPDVPEPQPWPRGVLPTWIERQVDNVALNMQCAPDMPAMFALGALSVISLGHVEVEARRGHIEPTALYLNVSLPPSEAKSPAQGAMFDAVASFEADLVAAQAGERAKAESQRKVYAKKASRLEESAAMGSDPDALERAQEARQQAEQVTSPPEGRLMTTDITPERLGTLMADNAERIAIVSDEAGVLQIDRYGDKASGRNLDVYLKAWSGRPATIDRQTAPSVRLRHPLLAIVVAAQPEAWSRVLADEELRNRGFTARFMACSPRRMAGHRHIDLELDLWDQAAADTYNGHLGALARRLHAFAIPLRLHLGTDARRLWSTWAQDLEHRVGVGGDLETEAGWIGKLRDSVIRTAALLHIAEADRDAREVTGDAMGRAIRIGDYWIQHRLAGLEEVVETLGARRLLACLHRLAECVDDGIVTRRDIGRAGPRGLRKVEEVLPAVVILEQLGWVRIVTPESLRGLPADARFKSCDGLLVHPSAGARQPRDTARHARQEATHSGRLNDDQHAESTDVAPVARVAYIGDFHPPPPSVPESPQEPRATRATALDHDLGTLFAPTPEDHTA